MLSEDEIEEVAAIAARTCKQGLTTFKSHQTVSDEVYHATKTALQALNGSQTEDLPQVFESVDR